MSNLSSQFDPLHLIKLPVENITKIYCAFSSLLEMTTPLVDQDDYEKLNTVCARLNSILSVYLDEEEEEENDDAEDEANYDEITPASETIANRLPNDYTDFDGYKHYFL